MAGKRKTISSRAWLNTDTKLTACVAWEHSTQDKQSDVFLTIKDCYRTVSLDFHHKNERTKKKSLVKINKLINILNELKTVIENS
jgi:hypothetical protein